jgi:hypothetical protein
MKHWFFAFAAVVVVAWVVTENGWDRKQTDPVQRRAELQIALRHAEDLAAIYRENRELLIRIHYLQEMSIPGQAEGEARQYARELVDDDIQWHLETLQWLREDFNQGRSGGTSR